MRVVDNDKQIPRIRQRTKPFPGQHLHRQLGVDGVDQHGPDKGATSIGTTTTTATTTAPSITRKTSETAIGGGINVLSLGGSTTWGSGLESRTESFPGLLLKEAALVSRSDNLAIRASSAMWPATCLQSLLDQHGLANINYHVVLLEFSINGLQGLELLLQRIRLRFPDSLIIYVDLYSNRTPGFSNCLTEGCKMNPEKQGALTDLIKQVGGYALSLPRPKDPMHYDEVLPLFQSDHHHLNERGHLLVANNILPLIRNHAPKTVSTGTWLDGDSCTNWFESGEIPATIQLEGGTMNRFARNKHAYEITSEQPVVATFLPNGKPPKATPLMLVFMTKGNPSVYPYVQANIEGQEATVVNPLSKKWADDHVTSTHVVGTMGPDDDRLHLKNIEPQKDFPFRLVGTVMCSACDQLGFNIHKRCQQRGCVHSVDD